MDNSMGTFSWGWVIFLILILFFFTNGNGFFGGNRNMGSFLAGEALGNNGSKVSNCDIERREIMDSAKTQYLIEEQANLTRAQATSNTNLLANKIDFYAYQELRDKLNKSEMNNFYLQNKLDTEVSNAQLNAKLSADNNELNRRLDSIQCHMLKAPQVAGIASSCTPVVSPNLCNPYYGYGCNSNNGLI